MSTLSAFIYKQRMRWYGRGIDRRHELRRRLAFYVAKYGFEIGDYSIGLPDIRLYNASRLIIGKYCSVSHGATFIIGGNHSTATVTTSFLDRPKGLGPEQYPYTRGDIVVGSDVWIAANAIILSGVTIGDGAVVGAGSVVIENVPPYAIVFGNPARIVRKRFADDTIAALLEVRWWDLSREHIDALRPLLLSRDAGKLIDECRRIRSCLQSEATSVGHEARSTETRSATRAGPDMLLSRDEVLAVIQRECSGIVGSNLEVPFDDLGVDSFGMLTLRTRLEEAFQTIIDDGAWSSVIAPSDVIRILADARKSGVGPQEGKTASQIRTYEVNMPQMAAGGLSESWLFKEVGDLHWSQIMSAMGVASSQLKDGDGNRLYATFTRLQIDSTEPLAAYTENEKITIEGKLSRYGTRIFFNDANLRGQRSSTRMRLMSSFSKFGEAATNVSLLRGETSVDAHGAIPALADLPEFVQEYRARRNAEPGKPVFECEYAIVPYHDINGVGLLYFAAYPIINDICAERFAGRSYVSSSTVRRDVFYFANSDMDETLIYRIHSWRETDDTFEAEASLSRKSDGALMAYIFTTKCRKQAGLRSSPLSNDRHLSVM